MRSKFVCQLCGTEKATDAHHWALEYPTGNDVKADDLTGLCIPCHNYATVVRGLVAEGVDRRVLDEEFQDAVDEKEAWQDLLGWYRFTWVRNKLRRQDSQLRWAAIVIVVESLMLWHFFS